MICSPCAAYPASGERGRGDCGEKATAGVAANTVSRLLPAGENQLGPDDLLEDNLRVPLQERRAQLPLELRLRVAELIRAAVAERVLLSAAAANADTWRDAGWTIRALGRPCAALLSPGPRRLRNRLMRPGPRQIRQTAS